MRSVTLDCNTRSLVARDIPEPESLADNEVLFRVREVGVCGTDRELASFRSVIPPAGASYLVLGHEAFGEVIATGKAVTGISIGEYVAPTVRRSCHPACVACAAHRRDLCVTGEYTERGILGEHGYFTEQAVDRAADLVSVPPSHAQYGVLIEPLSVVEKALDRALALHPLQPRTALVIGAGTVGLLTAMVLRSRGLETTVQSVEAAKSPRARLVELTGARYVTRGSGKADIVIEAAGADAAAAAAIDALGRNGVLCILGAHSTPDRVALVQMILQNHVVFGSVNASPGAARKAVEDLVTFDHHVLASMIHRVRFGAFRESILGSSPDKPKIVHVIE